MEKVASMQFDSTEEVARQLGLEKNAIPPVPLSRFEQKCFNVTGEEEDNDPAVKPPPANTPKDPITKKMEPWAEEEAEGPRQLKPYAAVYPPEDETKPQKRRGPVELDPHNYADGRVGVRGRHSSFSLHPMLPAYPELGREGLEVGLEAVLFSPGAA